MTTQRLNFNQIIDALMDDDAEFPITYIMSLSDIFPVDLEALSRSWTLISPARKAILMENIEVFHESEITSNFEDVATLALDDINAAVRISGLRLFWDYENSHMIKQFIKMLESDTDIGVRAQAASTLGKYMYLAEIESIDLNYRTLIDNALLKVLRSNEDELVRQKALEAFGYSSHPSVTEFIHIAYNSGNYNWISSALLAIGRSADENYASLVLPMLVHPDLRIQKEAIFAAGELELSSTKKFLKKLVLELEPDENLWVEAVSALSKIGGDGVSEVFERLLEKVSTDEEEDFLNEAIENLNLTNDMSLGFDLMGLKEPVEDSLREIDLEDDDFDLDDYGKSWIEELEDSLDSSLEDEFGEDEEDDNDEDDY
jgi:HEAT repeat protein